MDGNKPVSFVAKENFGFLREVAQLKILEKQGKIEGSYENIDERAYHHRHSPGLSSSGLVTIGRKSYGHYLSDKENPKEPSKAMIFGTAFHTRLLEYEKFKQTYILEPEGIEKPEWINRRTKEGKQQFKDWQENVEKPFLEKQKNDLSGKIILDQETFDKLELMVEMALKHPKLKKAMEGALFEVSFYWRDPETGLLLKCRTDIINMDMKLIIDVKTALDASEDGFGRACVNFDYDVKAEFYLKVIEGLYGPGWDYFFYACEKEKPFAPLAHHFFDALRENARIGVDNWISKTKASIDGTAPLYYAEHIVPLNLPTYGFDTQKRFGEKYEY